MTACLLLALWFAVRADSACSRSSAWRVASVAAFIAALAAKESAVVFPLLYLSWLVASENRPWRAMLVKVWPYAW